MPVRIRENTHALHLHALAPPCTEQDLYYHRGGSVRGLGYDPDGSNKHTQLVRATPNVYIAERSPALEAWAQGFPELSFLSGDPSIIRAMLFRVGEWVPDVSAVHGAPVGPAHAMSLREFCARYAGSEHKVFVEFW